MSAPSWNLQPALQAQKKRKTHIKNKDMSAECPVMKY